MWGGEGGRGGCGGVCTRVVVIAMIGHAQRNDLCVCLCGVCCVCCVCFVRVVVSVCDVCDACDVFVMRMCVRDVWCAFVVLVVKFVVCCDDGLARLSHSGPSSR